MAYDHQFDLFIQNDKGKLWRGSFNDFDEAKRKAQALADAEGFESFIYSLKDHSEIARFFPSPVKSQS